MGGLGERNTTLAQEKLGVVQPANWPHIDEQSVQLNAVASSRALSVCTVAGGHERKQSRLWKEKEREKLRKAGRAKLVGHVVSRGSPASAFRRLERESKFRLAIRTAQRESKYGSTTAVLAHPPENSMEEINEGVA